MARREDDRPLDGSREESEYSREDVRRRRKKSARRRLLRRLLVLTVLVALVAVLWNHWDTLAPDKLIPRLQDSLNDSGGSYPVDVSGSNVKMLAQSQSYTVTLSDSYLTYYNSAGSELTRYSCTYSNALLALAGRYTLVAEQGGKRFQLHTRSMTVTEGTAERSILAAAVNAQGQVALLTQGADGYAVDLVVYDRRGTVLYTRSRSRQAVSVALSPSGEQAALLSVEAVNGVLNTVVEAFSVTSDAAEALYAYTATDTLLYRVSYLNNNRLAVAGEDGIYLLDKETAANPTVFPLTGQRLLSFAPAEDGLAVAVRSYGDTGGGTVIVWNSRGEECVRSDFSGDLRSLTGDSKGFVLLTDSYVQSFSYTAAGEPVAVASDGQQAVRGGKGAVVLGLSALQSYSF